MSDYKQILNHYLDELEIKISQNTSEDSIRRLFIDYFLVKAFPSIKVNEIDFETFIPEIPHSAGAVVSYGFADVMYQDLIFEIKRNLNNQAILKGESELLRYINSLENSNECFGFLTDGKHIRIYRLTESKLIMIDEFQLSRETHEDSFLRLDAYLFQSKNSKPTAKDIALRFGEKSPVFLSSMRVLEECWEQIKDSPEMKTKFHEWGNLLSIVYGTNVGDDFLFLKHTYLACFSRILAFLTIEREIPSLNKIAEITYGTYFKKLGLENFITEDFYSWINSPVISEKINNWLNRVTIRLGNSYDLSKISEDVLKVLYQELVDPETRHDLGEVYTPDWLAEEILNSTGFPVVKKNGSITEKPFSLLDPSCGSGTFIFLSIHKLREAGLHNNKLVEYAINNLAGLDVHPLAVTISKSNFILALGADLQNYSGKIILPIYLANSFDIGKSQNTFTLKKKFHIIQKTVDLGFLSKESGKKKYIDIPEIFNLPLISYKDKSYLNDAIDALFYYSNPELKDDVAKEGFCSFLERAINDEATYKEFIRFWLGNLKLSRWLLRQPSTNNIWRFILRNAIRPQLLSIRKFDFIIGNPPWIAYRYLQSKSYQKQVRELTFQYNLIGKDKVNLFTQLELATLFYAFSQKHFLKDDGTIAFVMPRSILTGAKHHSNFMNRYVSKSTEIFDLQKVEPLFKIPACVLISKKTLGNKYPKYKEYSGTLPSKNISLLKAKPYLNINIGTFEKPKEGVKSIYFTDFLQGASLVPRSLWFVMPKQDSYALNPEMPFLTTDTNAQRKAKTPWKNINITGNIEKDFLYWSLLSDNLLPFGNRKLSLIVSPIKNNQLLNKDKALIQGYTGLSDWLHECEIIWDDRRSKKNKKTVIEWINWNSKLSKQNSVNGYRVLYGSSGSHIASCVINIEDILLNKIRNISPVGFVCESKTYYYVTESENESYYLCAYLNSPYADESIKPYQTKGSFGAKSGGGYRDIHRRPFEINGWPLFDSSNKKHLKLSKLGRKSAYIVNNWVSSHKEDLTKRIGTIRNIIRNEVISEELSEINEIVLQFVDIK